MAAMTGFETPPHPDRPADAPVVAITGAGGGLGRTFAVALADAGWTVAALGRTRQTLEETVVACRGDGHLAVVCDVTDRHSVAAAFAQVTGELGRLDLLVNNAGVPGPTGRIDTIDPTDFDTTVRTNLTGAFLCTQAAFTWMAAHGGGRIINNGSIAAHAPRAGAGAYAASKAAVASLTVSTALDGRDVGITATELDIGNARTALLDTFTTNAPSEPTFDAADAARLLVSVAQMPTDVSVDRVTVTAAGMPYLGRG
ncbi:Short-chain dehydrogenase/reductase [Corynebacterium glyciniphilum AJ 3170]|uniref:Short-chain dehydrogenase/reductase n=2 Tax=Corynebacterium TaxID=1716 RepID=X5DT83_9CORY|nr:Short-chain dehydrogenase/reductase [Corynebacterium glyciniphilum AJ 3170]